MVVAPHDSDDACIQCLCVYAPCFFNLPKFFFFLFLFLYLFCSLFLSHTHSSSSLPKIDGPITTKPFFYVSHGGDGGWTTKLIIFCMCIWWWRWWLFTESTTTTLILNIGKYQNQKNLWSQIYIEFKKNVWKRSIEQYINTYCQKYVTGIVFFHKISFQPQINRTMK